MRSPDNQGLAPLKGTGKSFKKNISIVQLDSHVTSKNSYISTIKYLDKSILDTRDLKTLIEEARLTESGNSFQQLILRTKNHSQAHLC